MLIDHRTYHIKPGHTRTHLDIYEKYGYKAQTEYFRSCVAKDGKMDEQKK